MPEGRQLVVLVRKTLSYIVKQKLFSGYIVFYNTTNSKYALLIFISVRNMKMVGVEFCFTNLKKIQIRKILKLMFFEKATKFETKMFTRKHGPGVSKCDFTFYFSFCIKPLRLQT